MEVPDIGPQAGTDQLSERVSSPRYDQHGSVDRYRAEDNTGYTSSLNTSRNPDEDWSKISDLAERRRIQNRIAQRNYRKKIKERMADLERRAGDDANLTSKTNRAVTKTQEQTAGEMDTESRHKSSAVVNTYQPDHKAHHENRYVVPDPRSFMSPSASSSQKKVVSPLKRSPRSYDDLYVASITPSDSSSPLVGYPFTKNQRRLSESGLSDAALHAALPADPMLGDSTESKRTQRHPETFQCTLCPKRFTRAYNLRSHLRTHTDERPFVCTVCGEAFARQHDRKRHENLHSGEKRFVCKGYLNQGAQWGCGRRFAGVDALARHFRSEAGSSCIKPLMENEGLKLHSEDFDAIHYRFPAALLAQYPDLANKDWTEGDIRAEDIDDRSRFDSSDYESDDAGYVSGTETGFGDTSDWPYAASLLNGREVADDNRAVSAKSKKRVDDKGPESGPQTFPKTSQDKSSSTDTGAPNQERQSPGEAIFHAGRNQDHSQFNPGQENRGNVNETEMSLHENTDHHHSDDNMSLRSFAESVFDNASIVSSASSLNSNSHAMVTSFVDMLARDPNMDSLLAITTSELGVSSGRFTRNFSRILKSYSRHLQQAARGSSNDARDDYFIAAKSVRNARHQVSNLVASRYNERASSAKDFQHREVDLISRHLEQPVPQDNDDPSSNEESSADESDLTIEDLEQFLLSGEPFRLLKRNLRSLVIPDEFLYCVYESTREFLDLIFTDRRPRSFARGLLHSIANGRDVSYDIDIQVRLMAAELKAECTDISQLDVSIFLETYSQYISMIAIDQVKDVFTGRSRTSKGPVERILEAPIPHADMLEKIVADTLPSVLYVDLVPHRTFLASTSAFALCIDALRGIVYPTFFSEATRSVKANIRSAKTSEDRLLALEGQRVLAILSEMQSCLQPSHNPILFAIKPFNNRGTALNSAKLALEASTASEWDWWPLQPPRHPGNAARAGLSWKCSCGTTRHELTMPYYANELKRIFDSFPLSLGDSSGHIDRPQSSLGNNSSQGTRSTQSLNSSSMNSGGGQSASSASSTAKPAITPPESVVDFGTGSRRYIYVFLLMKASEYTLDTIDVRSMKPRDFFQALRTTYNKHRGLLRRALSVFVYNHCDFIKIIKPEPDTFMPGELKFELPPDHDDEYHYRPRPIYSAPITKHMFRHYFYGCYDSGTVSHRLHTWLPFAPTCRIRNPAAEILEYFPKRDRPIAAAAQSEKVEVCYGIAARECRSFFRIVVYLCLIMAPALWFVFAWLFVWGDRGDLQDATVPMTLTLAVLSILWAVVYSGTDVRKDYGDGA